MISLDFIVGEIDRLTEDVAELDRDFVKEFPFEEYLAYLRDVKSYLGIARHPHVGRRRKKWFKSLVSSRDPSVLCRVNKLVFAFLIRESVTRLPRWNLPCDVSDLYRQWFDRVMKDLRELPDDSFRLESEEFIVDVGVCCLRSIPVGGAWVVQRSRVGLGPFVGGGPWQFFRYLSYMLGEAGGYSPYWVIHTATRYLPLFRPEEMDRAYMRIAELLKWDQATKGIYRGGWLLDPKLEEISPNLAFLRTVPQKNGARLFRSRTVQADIDWALSRSSIRRRLYKEGAYRPSAHAYIWPREAVLAWADRRKRDDGP